ncbi:nucleoid-associated protein [Exilibacterium tricleocarpae]|nr:nucleoid-associated protein [Exilibacterium tricleocarpae]
MPLSHAIAHYVSRPGGSARTRLSLRPDAYPISPQQEELVRRLKQAYIGKAGKFYGCFSGDMAASPLPRWLDEWAHERLGFASFSAKVMQQLQSVLDDSEVALDAHLLFFVEQLLDGDTFYLFVVDQCEGLYIDSNLDMNDVQFLDATQILFGAKVNLTAWRSGEKNNYLSVLRSRGDKALTELCWQLVGFSDQVDTAAETTAFLDIVAEYAAELPEPQARACRQSVVDYCLEQDKGGEPVSVAKLSEHIDASQPEHFSRFVAHRQPQPKPELIPDRGQLRQFVRLSGRNEQLSVSFSSNCLGETVVYDQQSDSITITDIPSSLKLRLLQHLQQQQKQQQTSSTGPRPDTIERPLSEA